MNRETAWAWIGLKLKTIIAYINTEWRAFLLMIDNRNVTESLIHLKYKYNSSLKRLGALVIAAVNAKLPRSIIVGETGTSTVAAAIGSGSAQCFATRWPRASSDASDPACYAQSAYSAAAAKF